MAEEFLDRVIRTDVQTIHIVRYILHNATRWGLVERWSDYPYAGSLVFTHEELAGTQDVPPPYVRRGASPRPTR